MTRAQVRAEEPSVTARSRGIQSIWKYSRLKVDRISPGYRRTISWFLQKSYSVCFRMAVGDDREFYNSNHHKVAFWVGTLRLGAWGFEVV